MSIGQPVSPESLLLKARFRNQRSRTSTLVIKILIYALVTAMGALVVLAVLHSFIPPRPPVPAPFNPHLP